MKKETAAHFEEYEKLKLQAKEIEKRLKELQPLIMPYIPEGKQIQASHGYFEIRTTTRYKFSEAVAELQAEEKAKGIATPQTTQALYYVTEDKESE